MPYSLDQLLDEFGGPKKTATFDGDYIDGLSPSSPASNPEMQPDLSDVPMDRRSGMMPQSLRVVREPQALPPQQPEAAPAPKPGPQEASGGFDWQRALTRLTDGREGVASLDSSRTASARLKLDQGRDQRQAAADENSLQEQKRRAELLRSASDPQSETSAKMRDEILTGFEVIGESMPNMKPMLAKFAGSMQNMSATDMLAMQERMGGVLNIARQAGHDRATEATAASDRSLKERQIEATIQDRAEDNKRANADMGFKYASLAESREQRKDVQEAKAAERAQLADEKAVSSYQKEAIPLDQNTKTLTDVKESKVKTGWIPDKFQKARQFFGFKDDDWDSAEGALASVSNEIRHGLFGASLTPGERAEFIKMLPGMDVPRATFDAKLKVVLDRMAEKKRMIDAGHPRAVKALGGAKSETPTLPKASSLKGDPAARIEEILKANPNHPRADELKAKLAELRGE